MSMTLTSLKADMVRYLERGGSASVDPIFVEQLPQLINFAERRIALELKIQGFQETVSGSLVVGQSVYDKPDRWRDTISFNIGIGTANDDRKTLLTRNYEYMRTFWPTATDTAEPVFYGDYDYNHWLVAPTPDEAYPFEILYYQLPELLSDDVQTNWITDFAPQLLLYASLLEATPFLKNDDRLPVWQAMYDRSAGMLNGEDLAKILDRAAVRKEA